MKQPSIPVRILALVLCVALSAPAVAGPPSDAPAGGERGGKEGKVPIYPLARQAGLTTLADLVELAGLQRTLTVEGPLTVFAPTNQAFEALGAAVGQEVLDMIVSDSELLTSVLLYHVVDPAVGAVPAEVAVTLSSAPMANGEEVALSFDGTTLAVGDATVIVPDESARNGIVHVIDNVLVPPSVLDVLSQRTVEARKAGAVTESISFGAMKAGFDQ